METALLVTESFEFSSMLQAKVQLVNKNYKYRQFAFLLSMFNSTLSLAIIYFFELICRVNLLGSGTVQIFKDYKLL